MWTRPTITWKLECEASKPRSKVYAMLENNQLDKNPTRSNYWIYWVAGVLLIALPTLVCCSLERIVNAEKPNTMMGNICFAQIFILLGAVGALLLSRMGAERINQKLNGVMNFAAINGCSDEFTILPVQDSMNEFRKGMKYQQHAVAFTITVICLVAITMFTTIILFCRGILGYDDNSPKDRQ